ncbi:MAG: hypothetical protein Q9227_006064 [Pyrenula ochraceoflavens]
MAYRALRRLQDPNDAYMAHIFYYCFKEERSNLTVFNQAAGYYRDIKDMVPTHDHGTSRWKVRADPPPPWPKGYVQQLLRPRYPPEEQGEPFMEWYDPLNDNIQMGSTDGCLNPANEIVTYHHPRDKNPALIATSTLCDMLLLKKNALAHWIGEFPLEANLGQADLNDMEFITSLPLFHEFFHYPPFNRDDEFEPERARSQSNSDSGSETTSGDSMLTHRFAYGWQNVQDLPGAESLSNADNYVYYGLVPINYDSKRVETLTLIACHAGRQRLETEAGR